MALTTFLHRSNAKHPPVPTPEPTPSAAAPVQLRPLRRSCQDRLVTGDFWMILGGCGWILTGFGMMLDLRLGFFYDFSMICRWCL